MVMVVLQQGAALGGVQGGGLASIEHGRGKGLPSVRVVSLKTPSGRLTGVGLFSFGLAHFCRTDPGQVGAHLGQMGPMLPELGQRLPPNLVRCWPNLPDSGQVCPEFDLVWVIWARCDRLQSNFDQSYFDLGQVWPILVKLTLNST